MMRDSARARSKYKHHPKVPDPAFELFCGAQAVDCNRFLASAQP